MPHDVSHDAIEYKYAGNLKWNLILTPQLIGVSFRAHWEPKFKQTHICIIIQTVRKFLSNISHEEWIVILVVEWKSDQKILHGQDELEILFPCGSELLVALRQDIILFLVPFWDGLGPVHPKANISMHVDGISGIMASPGAETPNKYLQMK